MQKFIMRNATSANIDDEYSIDIGFLPNDSTIQFTISGTGAISATFDYYISNDEIAWALVDTIAISGTNLATEITTLKSCFKSKCVLTSITSGATASVSVIDNE